MEDACGVWKGSVGRGGRGGGGADNSAELLINISLAFLTTTPAAAPDHVAIKQTINSIFIVL